MAPGVDVLTVAALLLLSCIGVGQAFEGDLRLVDNFAYTGGSAGRLEIFLYGEWGTVCSEDFDLYEADLACKQLGYLYADRVGTVSELGLSQGNGPIKLEGVSCGSYDSKLYECQRDSFISDWCIHQKDVGLICSVLPSKLRLIGANGRTANLSAGRLEILINNQWGTVCSDEDFGYTEANVACKQLGFLGANAYGDVQTSGYSSAPSSAPVWLSSVSCFSSSASDLRACSHDRETSTSCVHSRDVVLSCYGPWEVRLVQDVSWMDYHTAVSAGRLEIYLYGQWGTVCDLSFSQTEADVACRQLGFGGASYYSANSENIYPVDEYEPVWLEEVSCSFNDQTIYQCNHQPAACSHSQDIALQCSRFSEEFPIPTTSWWPGPWWRTTDNPWEWQTATTASGSPAILFGTIGVGVVVTVTLLVLIAVCVVIYHRRRNTHSSYHPVPTTAPAPSAAVTRNTSRQSLPPQTIAASQRDDHFLPPQELGTYPLMRVPDSPPPPYERVMASGNAVDLSHTPDFYPHGDTNPLLV